MLYILLAHGFEEIEALGTVDFLRRLDIEVLMASVTGGRLVKGAHGIPVMTDCLFRRGNAASSDGIILPGGMPGAENLRTNSAVRRSVQALDGEGKLLAAICAAPMVLGDCGILEGRKAVCYPGFEHWLHGAHLMKRPGVQEDGHIITAKGPAFTLDFAAAIALRFKDETAVQRAREGMLFK